MHTQSQPSFVIRSARSARLWLIFFLLLALAGAALAAPGDLDSGFGLSSTGITFTDLNAFSTDQARAVAIQPTGEIVTAGSSGNDLALVRYTAAGLPDATFSGDGIERTGVGDAAVAHAVAVQADGAILAAGTTTSAARDRILLVRYTSTGGLDPTFNATGIVTTTLSAGPDVARAIALQNDDKIVVAGSANGQFALLRYNPNGSLDTTFGGGDGIVLTGIFGFNDLAHAVVILPDDRIIVAGQTDNGSTDDFALARYTSLGALDLTFGGGDGKVTTDFGPTANDFILSLALPGDGTILAAGYSAAASEDFAIARYDSAGNLDTGFATGGKLTVDIAGGNDQALSVALQSSGKIILAGYSHTVTTFTDFTVVRLTTAGAPDATFGGGDGIVTTDLGPLLSGSPASHTDDVAGAGAVQGDNMIVVAGATDHPLASGDFNFAVARYTSPNTAPGVSAVSASATEDSTHTFARAAFDAAFSDADGDSLQTVMLTGLPASGTLRYLGVDVTLNQEIPASGLGSLTYTPAADFNGSDSFGWNGSDGIEYAVSAALVNLTVGPVNDAPSFTKGSNQTVNEDSGAASIPGWASAISAGPTGESGQVLTFTVTTDNDALFAVLPAADPANGTLSFTPAANASGSALASIHLQDSGGTLNGGVDTSAIQTFLISVTPVNDAPSFTKGGNQSVNEDPGAQSVAGWATGISAGPADESGQALTFLVTAANPGLFASGPAVSAAGDLSYTPAANINGTSTITVTLTDNGGTLNGGVNASAAQTFTISVAAVNDPPDFTTGANQVVLEDAGAQSITAWATGISAGGPDESGQTLTFQATAANTGLFSVQPAISPAGALTYTPAANANGSSNVTVTLQDNGGGSNTSTVRVFSISVTAVNDAPSFSGGPNQVVNEDSGMRMVAGWAANMSAGPSNESFQSLSFQLSSDNPGLFDQAPEILSTGLLHFTPAANLYGTATVTATLTDSGGVANGGVNASQPYTFTITVNPLNDAPSVSAVNMIGFTNARVNFSAADFTASFSDVDGDALVNVQIAWLPAGGSLTLNGVAVTQGQEIAAADLGGLVFTPNAGFNGLTVFGWNGSDGTLYAAAAASVNILIDPTPPQRLYLPVVKRHW